MKQEIAYCPIEIVHLNHMEITGIKKKSFNLNQIKVSSRYRTQH
jgi:hypothetical protein